MSIISEIITEANPSTIAALDNETFISICDRFLDECQEVLDRLIEVQAESSDD